MNKVIKAIGKAIAPIQRQVILKLWFFPPTSRIINRFSTNRLATVTTPRPRAFSLWSHVPPSLPEPNGSQVNGPISDFTAWPSLTRKDFSSRHLPPKATGQNPPSIADLSKLFERKIPMQTDRNSLLFMFFAQWLTDSVLRIDQNDRRKNTSNHEVDLCQIYGLKEDMTNLLRLKKDGKLKYHEVKNGDITEHYPERLYEADGNGGWKIKTAYAELKEKPEGKFLKDFIATQERFLTQFENSDWRKEHIYLTGLDNGNSSIGYVVFTTLFLREHNRICDLLIKAYKDKPEWQFSDPTYFDERVFQTARLINIAIMLKLTLEEYINHISGKANFRLDTGFAEQQSWYRTNWITLEFNLLYRWHSMVPENIKITTNYPHEKYRFNNALFETKGFDAVITALSQQAAGKICLQNTPDFLIRAEQASLQMARDFKLQSYNQYRKQFDLDEVEDFSAITKNKTLADALSTLYKGDINAVEFLPGLFAQDPEPGKLFGDLLVRMISYDALTQIYTNPLLSENIFTAATLTEIGKAEIDQTTSFQQLALRNSALQTLVATFKAPPQASSNTASEEPNTLTTSEA